MAYALVTPTTLTVGSRVRFTAPLSGGGWASWTSVIERIEGDVALVRHPRRARTFPFSPVRKSGLYRYELSKMVAAR